MRDFYGRECECAACTLRQRRQAQESAESLASFRKWLASKEVRADLAPPSRDSAQVPVAWTKSEYIKGHLSPASWILVDEGLKKYSRNSDAYDQPLYTAPAPDEGVDARDAERYRWLRAHPVWQVQELPNELELLDAAIDAALAADRGRAGGDEGEKG